MADTRTLQQFMKDKYNIISFDIDSFWELIASLPKFKKHSRYEILKLRFDQNGNVIRTWQQVADELDSHPNHIRYVFSRCFNVRNMGTSINAMYPEIEYKQPKTWLELREEYLSEYLPKFREREAIGL